MARLTGSFSSWLIALALGALFSLPWQFAPTSTEIAGFLEIVARPDSRGTAQLYFDRGGGLREADSTRIGYSDTATPVRLRFPLPAGEIRGFRLDPSDGPIRLSIEEIKLVDLEGETVQVLPVTTLSPEAQIQRFSAAGKGVDIESSPQANDPSLRINLPSRVRLSSGFWTTAARGVGPVLLWTLFSIVLVELVRQGPNGRVALAAHRHPRRAIVVAAALAAVASSYPVVFLGKSFVSPNYGTTLLYPSFPTLPLSTEGRYEDNRGSDVGAIMWSHLPLSMIQGRALMQGELPVWNRDNSTGVALLGQGQSMFGDPLQLVVSLLGSPAWAWDLKYVVAKLLLASGLGLAAWRVTGHLFASVLLAVASVFTGFFLYRVNHPAFFTFCYSPWVLVAWIQLSRDPAPRRIIRAAAYLALANAWVMMSGTVKEAYMMVLGLNGAGALVVLWNGLSWRIRLAQLGGAVSAGVIALLLTAPSWVTLLEQLRSAHSGYNTPHAYQIHPSFLLGLFDEIFYRPIQAFERVSNPSANFLILGGLLYLAAAWAARPCARACTAMAVSFGISLAFAFGVVPPSWIVKIPFLGNVAHIDNCFSLVAILTGSLLSAAGYETLLREAREGRGRARLGQVSLMLAILAALWIAITHTSQKSLFGPGTAFTLHRLGETLPVSRFVWVSFVLLPLSLVGFLWSLQAMARNGWRSPWLAGLAVLAVTLLLWRHGQHAPSAFDDYVNNPTARVDFAASSPAIEFVKRESTEPARVVGTGYILTPGWNSAYGLETISGPDALGNSAYRELVQALGLATGDDWRIAVGRGPHVESTAVYDFLNVRWVLQSPGQPNPLPGLTSVGQFDLDVYRSPTTWPRAFFTDRIERYRSVHELADWIRNNPGMVFAAADHTAQDLPTLPESAGNRVVTAAARYELTPNTTRFEVNADRPGVAVLHEAFEPANIRAFVNGEPSPVFRINHAFRGVEIPGAGRYQIRFEYWPRSLGWALGASGLGTALVLVALVVSRRNRVETARTSL